MIHIPPGSIGGRIQAPASKSHSQRLLLAACFAKGESVIHGLSRSEDGVACLRVIQALGSCIHDQGDSFRIQGGMIPHSDVLDCGESGFCLRAVSALAALSDRPLMLRGHGSLMKRPVEMLVEPLRRLGVRCETNVGFPPIRIQGPLKGGSVEVDGSISSQFLSGLLMALPLVERDSDLAVRNLRSVPYIRMTLDVLDACGIRLDADDALTRFHIPGGQRYRVTEQTVEGDWSGAAFLLVAAALAGEVIVDGLKRFSRQADRAVLDALEAAGAAIVWEGESLRVRHAELRAFNFDATDCPDLFPPLAALACHASGTSRIYGVHRLKHKESDRAATLISELGAMGAVLRVQDDAIEIEGGPLKGGKVDSHADHRIAMACAVAALKSEQGVAIEGEACVSKSYPEFFEHLAFVRAAR